MSSVPPPKYFGEHFVADVIKRSKQKILLLRETATSMTWATFVTTEWASALRSALRQLLTQLRPPNTTRQASCRVDNASALKSLTADQCLSDLGVTLDLSNPAYKNGNPCAEKAIRELHDAIKSVNSSGQGLSSEELASAVSLLNSRPRWSTMSAIELWTGRDMLTGETLLFDQHQLIHAQHSRREGTHPSNVPDEPVFKVGDTVFSNNESCKLKPRDRLVVRENLGKGMYRLDRYHETSGRITRAILLGRQLFKPTSNKSKQPQPLDAEPTLDTTATTTQTAAVTQTTSTPVDPSPRIRPARRQELPVPVAPDMAHTYVPAIEPRCSPFHELPH